VGVQCIGNPLVRLHAAGPDLLDNGNDIRPRMVARYVTYRTEHLAAVLDKVA
jgi:hypothetical protein